MNKSVIAIMNAYQLYCIKKYRFEVEIWICAWWIFALTIRHGVP